MYKYIRSIYIENHSQLHTAVSKTVASKNKVIIDQKYCMYITQTNEQTKIQMQF